MTRCKECGTSIAGKQIVVKHDMPFSPGDPIPEEGDEYYEEDVGLVACPGCGREIGVSPKQYREEPAEI